MGNQPSTNNNNSGVATVGRNRNNHHNHAVPTVTTTNSTSSSSLSSGVQQQPAAVTVMKSMFQQLNRESKNALGLNKAELDERCKPSGLYSSCNWDEKAIRRLIGDGKLASRQQCTDEMQIQQQEQHECPICFFTYRQMNTTKCCQANICTECYLQLQPYHKPSPNQNQTQKPVMNVKSQQNACPFCNTAKLQISVAPIKTSRPPEQQQPEQPLVTPTKTATTGHVSQQQQPESRPNTTPKTGFGSSLEQNSHVAMMRARSCSIASEHSQSSSTPSIKEQQDMVSTVAATAEERQQLEEEMRAQHLHPLALKIQQEENERRLKNELQYYSQRNAMLQRQQQQRQESAAAAAAGAGASATSSGTLPSQQQPRRVLLSPQLQQQLFPHHHQQQLHRSGPTIMPTAVRGLSEEQQIALAIEASLRETTISGSNTTTTTTTTTP